LIHRKTQTAKSHKKNNNTDQFVLLHVDSLQLGATHGQSHHALVRDAVTLAQVHILQLTAMLPQLNKSKRVSLEFNHQLL
jgi:capsid protein